MSDATEANIVVHQLDWPVLRRLASSRTTVYLDDLAAALNRDRSVIGDRVRRLTCLGLAHRPHGCRSGVALTALGHQLVARENGVPLKPPQNPR